MLTRAKSLKIKPFYVLSDTWYGSVKNMKFVDQLKWLCISVPLEIHIWNEGK